MRTYGYEIVQTLIVDIEPDETVKRAMNEINAGKTLSCPPCFEMWVVQKVYNGLIRHVASPQEPPVLNLVTRVTKERAFFSTCCMKCFADLMLLLTDLNFTGPLTHKVMLLIDV
jgi:hypothetical protein